MCKLLLAVCVSLMTFTAIAQEEKPTVIKSQKLDVKATVEDIDRDKREITVRTPKGKRVLKAGEEVKNFDQIKKGDEITATFYESVAYSIAKKGEPATATPEVASVYAAEKGEKPAALAVKTKQTSATVQAINPETREMTLKDAEGKTFTVTVDERAGDLSRIKKGDEIVANYTEALAISVTTPQN